MYKLLLTALFCASFAQSYAQDILNKIKQNPDISWAQTTILEFDTKVGYQNMKLSGGMSQNLVVKHQMPLSLKNSYEDFSFHSFAGKIATKDFWGQAKNKCYKDPQLQHLLSPDQIGKKIATIDTVITFDPKDFKEIVELVPTTYGNSHITHFKLFLCYAYNSKSKQLEIYPISMAPIVGRFDAKGQLAEEVETFWIPVESSKQLDPKQEAINWIQKQQLSWTFKGNEGQSLVKKQTVAEAIMDQVEELTKMAKAKKAYTKYPLFYGEPLDAASIKNLKAKQAEDIKGIFFSYVLAWDAQQQKAIFQIEGSGPFAKRPLYYLVD